MSHIPAPKIFRSRRSSITIQVTPTGELVVKAPLLAPNFVIQQFIMQKENWIIKMLEKVQVRQAPKRAYTEGEVFLVLGVPHKLVFVNSIEIVAKNGKLHFPKALEFRIKKELENWFIKQAKETITRRVEHHAKQMQAEYKSIMFSDTSSKWGTCTYDNRLQFNWRLIMAPLLVLDYVVIHELAHTTEKNHARSFWNKVRQFTPAYRQHREWLNKNGHVLHI